MYKRAPVSSFRRRRRRSSSSSKKWRRTMMRMRGKESQMKFVPLVDHVLVHGMTMREAGQ